MYFSIPVYLRTAQFHQHYLQCTSRKTCCYVFCFDKKFNTKSGFYSLLLFLKMQAKDIVILRLQHMELFVFFRHWGTALQEGWVEPSDQARGRGEGATATRHPSPLWQTEQGQWEPLTKACSPGCIWPHHCRNGDCIHKGVFLPQCFRKHVLTVFQNI